MMKGLHSAVTAEDDALRCIVIRARGPVFSAGHNLKHIVSWLLCSTIDANYTTKFSITMLVSHVGTNFDGFLSLTVAYANLF